MIPSETVERIYASAHIEDVISDYVTLRKRGANLIGLCPFHDEKTGSFTVSPAKGIYKCFGCGKAGNVVNFLMEYEQCSYIDALRSLAKRYHIEIQERELTEEEQRAQTERESMFMLNEWASDWFQHNLWETEEGRTIGLKYFLERGIREDIIKKFHLGYSPDRNALYSAAHEAKFEDKYLESTGLCGKSERGGYYDRFRGRVMFPIYTVSGKVVAFAGRILKKQEHVGKYVNSPDSPLYSKRNELYGLSLAKQAIPKQGCCYLVEGQMDVISMHQAGIENVVSSGGTALTKRQIILLHRFTENVTILYDGDSAGIHAAQRGIDMLLEQGLNIKVVLLPDGDDPDSFARKHNAADFIQFIQANQQDFIHFKTNLLLQDSKDDPIKRSEVIKGVLKSISVIPDVIKRQVYIQACSKLLEMPESALLEEVRRLQAEQTEQEQKRRRQQANGEAGDGEQQEDKRPTTGQQSVINGPRNTLTFLQSSSLHSSDINDKKLDENIRNLLKVLIQYGDKVLYSDDDGNMQTVGEYILADLDNDQIEFSNALYNKVISEFRLHRNDEEFLSEAFFKYHTDPAISQLTVNLISEKYTLSKIHGKKNVSENVSVEVEMPTDEDRLAILVPQLLYELKLTLINQQIDALRVLMQHAQDNHDEALLLQLLQEQPKLEQIKRSLCLVLGQRIQ